MNAPFDQLFTWLKDHKITEVECVVSDLTSIARGKIAPTNKFLHGRGMRLPESVLLQTVTGDFVDDDIYYDLLDPADIDMVCKPAADAVYVIPWAIEPTAIEDALTRMEECETIERYLGSKFVRGYFAVKRAEHENFKRVISSWEREFLLLSV